MRAAIALIVTSGCALVFPLEEPGPPAPPPPGTCSIVTSLADEFDQPPLASIWRVNQHGSNDVFEIANGQAHLGPGDNDEEVFIETQPLFDLQGSSITVDVSTSGDFGPAKPSNFASLDLQATGFTWGVNGVTVAGDAVLMRWQGANLSALRYAAGQLTSVESVPYDPQKHRTWRIAKTGDDIVWSTSADRVTFTELTRFPLPAFGMVRPRLYTFEGGDGPMNGFFDHVNASPAAPICPAEQLTDDFAAALDGNVWEQVVNGCSFAAGGGMLTVVDDPFDIKLCSLVSDTVFDLIDHAFTIEIDGAVDGNHQLSIEVDALDGASAGFQISPTMLSAAGTRQGPAPYGMRNDPSERHLLRLRGQLDPQDPTKQQLVWETSADGVAFELLARTGDYQGLDRVRLRFHAEGDLASIGTIAVLGVNRR